MPMMSTQDPKYGCHPQYAAMRVMLVDMLIVNPDYIGSTSYTHKGVSTCAVIWENTMHLSYSLTQLMNPSCTTCTSFTSASNWRQIFSNSTRDTKCLKYLIWVNFWQRSTGPMYKVQNDQVSTEHADLWIWKFGWRAPKAEGMVEPVAAVAAAIASKTLLLMV